MKTRARAVEQSPRTRAARMPRTRVLGVIALAAAHAMFARPVPAQTYPTKPIRLIVPFPPGGGNDFIGRFIAERVTISLRRPVVVDNRGGAGGTIGIEAGVAAAPDGHTLTLISPSYTINPSLYKIKFDPVSDITPIIRVSHGALMLVAHPSVQATSVKELIALAKARPGKLNYASSGQGGIVHLACEHFSHLAGIRLTHVPYKGGGPALVDTYSGQVDLFFSTLPAARPHVTAGKLRALGVTTARRIAAFPDVPSIAESGVTGYDVTLWHGLIGPKGLPKHILQTLNREVNDIIAQPETEKKLATDGVLPAGGTSAEFLALIKAEIRQWRDVTSRAGVKPE